VLVVPREDQYRLQMPWKMLLSLLPPSFLTIRFASGTLASASFSRFLTLEQHKKKMVTYSI
jgi:hypothetical protein